MSAKGVIDLGGRWRFRPDPKRLGEHYRAQLHTTHADDARWMEPDYDDAGWPLIAVPACWQTIGYDDLRVGWYRTAFASPLFGDVARVWLQFDGADYLADVWLNGHYLGSHEGYFGSFGFDITSYLRPDQDNVLAVRVESPEDVLGVEHELWQLKTLCKGSLGRCDTNNPEIVPGGIWNSVTLLTTGEIRIADLTVAAWPLTLPPPEQPDARVEAAAAIEAVLSYLPGDGSPVNARVTTTIAPATGGATAVTDVHEVTLFPGSRTIDRLVRIPDAALWWTWDLGEPNLYRATVIIEIAGNLQDRLDKTFGVRQIERGEGWTIFLNGTRFFQRGANYHSDQLLSTMDAARYALDIRLLREANLNTVHPFCVVERHEFYDACDAAGLLVYQDFPIWMMASNGSDLVRRAVGQLKELIVQFGHHPAIVVWNMGSQPSVANFEKLCSALVATARAHDASRIVQQGNAAISYTSEDYLHPIGSFFWPAGQGRIFADKYDWRHDTHNYAGWYFGDVEDLVRRVPREHLELVTEFGAQALPRRATLESFIPPQDLFPPNWTAYARRGLQPGLMLTRVTPRGDLDQFIAETQAYQAHVVRYHVEFYRRHKFRPCNGAHVFTFTDCWPAISWALVEYDRTPKAAYSALQRSMAPLQAFLAPPEPVTRHDRASPLTVCIVNDTREDFPSGTCRIDIRTAAGDPVLTHSVDCAVSSLGLTDLEPVWWTAAEPGDYSLRLAFYDSGDRERCCNEYRLRVSPPAPDGSPPAVDLIPPLVKGGVGSASAS